MQVPDARIAAHDFFGQARDPLGLGDRSAVRQLDLHVELVAVDAGEELRLQGREGAEADHWQDQGAEHGELRKAQRQRQGTAEGGTQPGQVQAIRQQPSAFAGGL